MPSLLSASAVNHVDALEPGARLGEFEVLSLLGVGGFGMVYRAFDHSLMRFVAIKEYMPSSLAGRAEGQSLWVRSSSDEQSYQAGLASFVDEARLLAQFDHPSLVKVFRFWEANHTAYMVMPLYGGMTLKQARAHMRTPPSEAWLRKLLWSVLGALRVLHDAQMLHRDISPDNIFLQDMGPPVLLDLGAARRAISDRDRQHTAVLKVNYAPIEQYTDAGSDLQQGPWSDLYSLAAVMHGCLCNDTPLPATLRSIRDRMVPFSRVARTVKKQLGVEYSEPFVAAMAQALELRPQDRPQSIDAFAQMLELQAPTSGLEHFDFRAELGDVWTDPGAADASSQPASPVLDAASMPTTRVPQPLADVLAQQQSAALPVAALAPLAAAPASAGEVADLVLPGEASAATPAAKSRRAPQPSRRSPASHSADTIAGAEGGEGHGLSSSRQPVLSGISLKGPRGLVAALLGALVVAAIASALWWRSTPQPTRTPDSEIITEMAMPSAVPASAATAARAAGTTDAASAPANPASADLPPPAFVTATAPRPAKTATRRDTPAVATPSTAATGAAPSDAPAPAPPPVAAPAAPQRAARAPGPDEACASASLLARPMCVHRECQAAGAANHPVCVENRRRQEEEARKREMFSQ